MFRDVVVEKDAGQNRDSDYEPVWNLHECCYDSGEPKALDDECPEVGDAAVGDVADDAQKEK